MLVFTNDPASYVQVFDSMELIISIQVKCRTKTNYTMSTKLPIHADYRLEKIFNGNWYNIFHCSTIYFIVQNKSLLNIILSSNPYINIYK